MAQDSVLTAQKHIESIARNNCTLESLTVIANDAIEILANEFYDSSTHFLEELMQNADDTEYAADVFPTLTISLQLGDQAILSSISNEKGFRSQDVEAISTIRKSTKKNKHSSDGYTGEKGIGFKSVFRVADTVTIHSGAYRFMFDSRETLGTIRPAWISNSSQQFNNETHFTFQLSADCNQEELNTAVRNIEPTVLLFMTRIRRLKLHVTDAASNEWSLEIWNEVGAPIENGLELQTLHVANDPRVFYLFTHAVTKMPYESRRATYSSSLLRLAFDTTGLATQEIPGTVKTHSVLPIANYGLKFRLSADFLLTANRQHIDESVAWNCVLRDALCDAFVDAAKKAASIPSLAYTWPLFVPAKEVHTFFEPTRLGLLRELQMSPVLYASSGTLTLPCKLKFIDPQRFIDRHGVPFTDNEVNRAIHLSQQYPAHTIESLIALGVTRMDDNAFLDDLQTLITSEPDYIQSKTTEWRSDLAKALSSVAVGIDCKLRLRQLPIIPLHDGKWTAANTEPSLFPQGHGLDGFLKEVNMPIIDTDIIADPNWSLLFSMLEIKETSKTEICKHICELHKSSRFIPEHWTPEQLFAQARFLFRAEWRPMDTIDLWFATARGERCKGSEIYILEPNDHNSTFSNRALHQVYDIIHALHTVYNDAESPDVTSAYLTTKVQVQGILNSARSYKYPSHKPSAFYPTPIYSTSTPFTSSYVGNSYDNTAYFEYVRYSASSRAPHATRRIDRWPGRVSEAESPGDNTSRPIRKQQSNPKGEEFFKGSTSEWKTFLIDVLHARNVPRLYSQRTSDLPALSVEFINIFLKCDAECAVRTLTDNWHSYRKAIDKFEGSKHVLGHGTLLSLMIDKIKILAVCTRHGMTTIGDLIVSNLDDLIDDNALNLQTVDVEKHEELCLNQLELFGVTVKPNLRYYVACLDGLKSLHIVPSEKISYVYERIQAHSDEHEDYLDALFSESDNIYVVADKKTNNPLWLTINQCRELGVNIEEVVHQYPASNQLFRALFSVECRDRGILLKKALAIHESFAEDEIIKTLCDFSAALAPLSSRRAAIVARPLASRAVFPTLSPKSTDTTYILRRPDDKSWYIADRLHLQHSFSGKLPLMCGTPENIETLEPLLTALDLHRRRLSKLVVPINSPKGPVRQRPGLETFFDRRTEFVKKLLSVKQSDYTNFMKQLDNVTIYTAAEILQCYRLHNAGIEVDSHFVQSQVSIKTNDSEMWIYLAEAAVRPKCPFVCLVQPLAEYLHIEECSQYQLLTAALIDPRRSNLREVFRRAGTDIAEPRKVVKKSGTATGHGKRGYLIPISADETQDYESMPDSASSSTDSSSAELKPSQIKRRRHTRRQMGHYDPRIPKVRIELRTKAFHADVMAYETSEYYRTRDVPSEIEYLGYCRVDELLSRSLDGEYKSGVHWTSNLRQRAGHFPPVHTSDFPFLLQNSSASKAMTNFLIRSGHHELYSWLGLSLRYMIEVVSTPHDRNHEFSCNTAQLERFREYRLSEGTSHPEQVVILFKVSMVFHKPVFDIYIDPWNLLATHQLKLQNRQVFQALISESPEIERSKSQPCRKIQEASKDLHQPNRGASLLQNQHYNSSYGPPLGKLPDASSTSNKIIVKFPTSNDNDQRDRRFDHGQQDSHSAREISEHNRSIWTSMHVSTTLLMPSSLSSQDYIYMPCMSDEIRLFVLFPGEFGTPLRGLIMTVVRDDAPPYIALSYVWKTNASAQHEVCTPEGKIFVQESLYEALHWLRSERDSLILWIDAICIDQTFPQEKAEQIRSMGRVFQGGACTYGFLGSDSTASAAIETLLQIQAHESQSKNSTKWPENLPQVPESWSGRAIPLDDDPIWSDITDFFARRWFHRAWIVQEAVIAPTLKLICGKWRFDFEDLHLAATILERERPEILSAISSFIKLADHRQLEDRVKRIPFFNLLEAFRHVDSSLTRDRFFALIGLAEDGDHNDFYPDYQSSLEAITMKIARGILSESLAMDLLYKAGSSTDSQRFPSWMPDWTIQCQASLAGADRRGASFYATQNDDYEDVRLDFDRKELHVAGYTVDSIARITANSNIPRLRRKYFEEIEKLVNTHLNKNHLSNKEDIIFSVPIADARHSPVMMPSSMDIRESYEAFRKILKKASYSKSKEAKVLKTLSQGIDIDLRNDPLTEDRFAKSLTYVACLDDTVLGWKFIATKEHRFGIVPPHAKEGDVIALFAGGDVPFVIRETPQGKYRLVGQCFVDSLVMYGNCMDDESITKNRRTITLV